ncbi:MAG: tannase/feruloyl esterase family alpha/beta hydrolase [Pseudomonadales bacterium]
MGGKSVLSHAGCTGLMLALLCLARPAAADACAGLLDLTLPDVHISAAQTFSDPVAHCRADGVIAGSIRFSVWLPDDWNGKFFMGGGGGMVGSVQNHALASLAQGYATAGTDTGHRSGGFESAWALGDQEAVLNYAYVAVHRTAEVAKAVIAGYYSDAPRRSYFLGCSNGGRQGMHSVQRYPDDFDGVVIGAPAFDFTDVGAAFVQITERMYPDPEDLSAPVISPAKRELLAGAVLDACDADDGLADGIISDPPACDFDPQRLACDSADTESCLTGPELAAVQAVYGGPQRGAGPFYVGYPVGAENVDGGWGAWLAGSRDLLGPGVPSMAYAFGMGLMRHFVYQDPSWTYQGYDWNRFEHDALPTASVLNAVSTDIRRFRGHGGKVLMYHGWADMALSANATVAYVESLYAGDPSARDDVRLFMMPGMLHCRGGAGPDQVDFIGAIDAWVERDEAPERLLAAFADGSGARPLCPHPQRAVYRGGPDRDPASFECR